MKCKAITTTLVITAAIASHALAALTADQKVLAHELSTIAPGVSLSAAPYASFDQLGAATAKAITDGQLSVTRAVNAAYTLPNSGVDYRNADPFVILAVSRQVAGDYSQIKQAVQAAYSNALANVTPFTSDDAAVAAALSSSAARGIMTSSTTPAKKTLALVTAVKTGVSASLALKGAVIKNYQPATGKVTTGAAVGAAGVVTGVVAQAQRIGSSANNAIVAAIVTGAVSVDYKQYLQITQAAAEAVAYVFAFNSKDVAKFSSAFLVDAVKLGLKTALKAYASNPAASKVIQGYLNQGAYIQSVVAFGVNAAKLALAGDSSYLGAGAAGVADYSFNSGTGSPVTDITGL
jgi:7-cyano-7-deazaguanine synthase in queuosine biosynthesis